MAINDRFLLTIDGLSQELRVARFAGREGVSELFHFEITFTSDDAGITPADAVGKTALLTLNVDEGEVRHVHGIVARLLCGDAGKKLSSYQVTMVPKVWRLLHRQDCRIFQQKTAPEI